MTTDDRTARIRDRLAPIEAEYPFTPHLHVHEDGTRQHYVDDGPRDGEPLLFLHGNPTWSFYWRKPILALRDRYRCIAPDHIGCGMSDKPQDYEYRLVRHIENVCALVESLGLKNVTLVVHDWGGAIGFGFARRHPDLVKRLVILNTAAFLIDRIPLRLAVCRVPLLGAALVRGLNGFALGATLMAVEKPLPPLAKRGLLLPYNDWANRVATLRFVEDIPMSESHPSRAEAKAIGDSLASFADRPAILLWGERDWCFTPTMRETFQHHLPAAEVHRFENAGHYVMEDAANEIVAAMEGFLAKHPLS